METTEPVRKHLYVGELVRRSLEHCDEIRLKYRYRRKTYTINALCVKMGVNERALKSYLHHQNRIPINTLDKLMAVLDFDILDILTPGDLAELFQRHGHHLEVELERNLKQARLLRRKKGRPKKVPQVAD